jgi:hypothetical protein
MRRPLYGVRCIQLFDALFDIDERGGLWFDPDSGVYLVHGIKPCGRLPLEMTRLSQTPNHESSKEQRNGARIWASLDAYT